MPTGECKRDVGVDSILIRRNEMLNDFLLNINVSRIPQNLCIGNILMRKECLNTIFPDSLCRL